MVASTTLLQEHWNPQNLHRLCLPLQIPPASSGHLKPVILLPSLGSTLASSIWPQIFSAWWFPEYVPAISVYGLLLMGHFNGKFPFSSPTVEGQVQRSIPHLMSHRVFSSGLCNA